METTNLSLAEVKEHAKKVSALTANRWKHRRRMAYIALISMLVVTYLCMFKVPTDKLSTLSDVVNWFYVTMGTIVGAYMGFSTLDDKWKESKKQDSEQKSE